MKGKLERKSTPESEALEESASDPLESIEHERKEESLYEKQDESLIEERTMEARKEFDAAIEKLKPKSRRKNINELVDLDEKAQTLIRKMYISLEEDENAIKSNKLPLSKMKMLKEVEENLTKQHMSEIFLDNGVLDVLRRWLEPTFNNTLSDPYFRLKILEILSLMPIETLHLRESGIGKIVMFFSRRNKEMKQIKNISDDLIFKWSKPILENYKKSRKLHN